ncbi:DUF5071 domain-containing protein [Solibacillus sp. R5-41]|uniref:DUF5071 domain-containing protein n=1 Tax=Solibacillus sp. R5-41 TaxID=2048654 RepID=UPI0020A59724|nr:DUF5071 domain-containing protein [Solibacillus sp. R5-41]
MCASEVIPLLPQLLEWIQDMNWPVAEPVLEVLLQYPTKLIPHVEEVLLGNDDMWIYWCLVKVFPALPDFSKQVLVNAVEQLAMQKITPFNEDIVETAKEALQSCHF